MIFLISESDKKTDIVISSDNISKNPYMVDYQINEDTNHD